MSDQAIIEGGCMNTFKFLWSSGDFCKVFSSENSVKMISVGIICGNKTKAFFFFVPLAQFTQTAVIQTGKHEALTGFKQTSQQEQLITKLKLALGQKTNLKPKR